MASILPPSSFAQTQGQVGHSYVFAAEAIRQELVDRLDVLGLGIVVAVGDLQGSGSDVIRVTRFGGLGWAEKMAAMVDETSAAALTGHTLNFDTVTIGRYSLAKAQTYQDQILSRAETLGLDDQANRAPNSWMATLRDSVCDAGATFASGVGTSGAAYTYDDELELVADFHETEGFTAGMRVVSLRHPEQFTDLRNSIRNEPGLMDASLHQSLLGLAQADQGAFNFLGISNYSTHDVPTSGGDHVGCAYVPGAIAWVVASTLPITPENPAQTVWVPEFGLIIERKATSETGTAKFVSNAWFGVDTLDPTLFPQFTITSVND